MRGYFALWLVLVSFTTQLAAQSSLESCVQMWITRRPELVQRFTPEQIAWLCNRTETWLKRALNPSPIKLYDTLTPAQKTWLTQLRNCQDPNCMTQSGSNSPAPKRRPQSDSAPLPDISPASVAVDRVVSLTKETQVRPEEADKAEHEACEIATLCPRILSKATGQTVQTKDYQAWKQKCQELQDALSRQSESWDDLKINCLDQPPNFNTLVNFDAGLDDKRRSANNKKATDDRKKVVRKCKEVLQAPAPRGNDKNAARWLVRCRKLQARLTRHNTTLDEWPNEIGQSSTLELELAVLERADTDFVNLNVTAASTNDARLASVCYKILTTPNAVTLSSTLSMLSNVASKLNQWKTKCEKLKRRLQKQGSTLEQWLQSVKQHTGYSETDSDKHDRRERTFASNSGRGHSLLRTIRQVEQDVFEDSDVQDTRVLRKEYRMLTDDERNLFHEAMNKLKSTMIDGISMYDLMVIFHTPEEAPGAHWGPAFLPYHREFLKQLEVALQNADATGKYAGVSLPYWDSTLDQGLPVPKDSILWTKEFFGNGDGEVSAGPFARWQATHEIGFTPGVKTLFRQVADSPFGFLYKAQDLEFIATRRDYSELTACVDPTFEMTHGSIHMFVGGYMADIAISPNDPTFFLHHCFVDYLWEQWRNANQAPEAQETEYPTDERSCGNFHYANSPMKPFPILNKDGLSSNYTQTFYYYAPRPSCAPDNTDCGPYLFCDVANYRCLSRIVEGGSCVGFENTDICLSGVCRAGVCVKSDQTTSTQSTTTASVSPGLTTTTASTVIPTTLTSTTPTVVPPGQCMCACPCTSTYGPPVTTTAVNPGYSSSMTTTGYASSSTTTIGYVSSSTTHLPATTTTTQSTTTTTRGSQQRPTDPTAMPAPNPSPTYPVSWFSCTVYRGTVDNMQPVVGATIMSCGKNVPYGYTDVLLGTAGLGTEYPSYPGAYLVQVKCPAETGTLWKTVEFTVEVADEHGRPCQPQCYNNVTKSYANCGNLIRLSDNSLSCYRSAPIPHKNSEVDALMAAWTTVGDNNTKYKDYLIFQCF